MERRGYKAFNKDVYDQLRLSSIFPIQLGLFLDIIDTANDEYDIKNVVLIISSAFTSA